MLRYVAWVSIQYLVRAEVPAAENGDPHHVPGPRDGAGDRVTEEVEGIRGGKPAVRAVQQLGGHGPGVQRVHLLYPANLVETWQRGEHTQYWLNFFTEYIIKRICHCENANPCLVALECFIFF